MKILQGPEQIVLDRWNALLKASPYASPFQSPSFYGLHNSPKSDSCAEVFALESRGQLKALCVVILLREKGFKGFFSRRALIYGGPLLLDRDTDSLIKLLKAITEKVSKTAIYLEIRNYHDYSFFSEVYDQASWEYLPYLDVQFPLEGQDMKGLMANMNANRRRQIRLSKKHGALAREARSADEVASLYFILEDLYRSRVKLPLPDLDYFQRLFSNEIGKVFVVLHGSKLIGGAFCLFLKEQGIYTQYYCGIRDYHKKIFPTHLAIEAAMKFSLEQDLKLVDLMGAGKKGEDYGVRKYKMEFGGKLVEPGRYLKVLNPALYQIGKKGLEFIKKYA